MSDVAGDQERAELDGMSAARRAVIVSFGELNPPLANFPHCVMRNGPSTFRRVLEVVKVKVGVWGAEPLLDREGKGHVEPESGFSAEGFTLFSLPLNQDHVLRTLAYGSLDFSMTIDVGTSMALLTEMYAHFRGEHLLYRRCTREVSQWLDRLGWAYIPLEYESQKALFVTVKANEDWIDLVTTKLVADGESLEVVIEEELRPL